jgi:hypothetical protein
MLVPAKASHLLKFPLNNLVPIAILNIVESIVYAISIFLVDHESQPPHKPATEIPRKIKPHDT